MDFINRKKERDLFENDYKDNSQNKTSQVYIVEAKHGIGKSKFIEEISKNFSCMPLYILPSDDISELSTFKNLVLELDKSHKEYKYDSFKSFYKKKADQKLFMKTTFYFANLFTRKNLANINVDTITSDLEPNKEFILKAQVENLFEYAEYAISHETTLHIIFCHASKIDLSSLEMISKLTTISQSNVFIFESDSKECSSRIENRMQNIHTIFQKKYILDKLSNKQVNEFIHNTLVELSLQTNKFDLSILENNIENGDLAEIESIIEDYKDRVNKNSSAHIRSMNEIISSLSDSQKTILFLAKHSNGKLEKTEILEIIKELAISYNETDIDYLVRKKIIENNKNYITLAPFVHQALSTGDSMVTLKYASASALIRNLNEKLSCSFNSRYVDILIEYYLDSKDYLQLESMVSFIDCRLKCFSTQAERVGYFQQFEVIIPELKDATSELLIQFAEIAYDANLYPAALKFIQLLNEKNEDEDIIFYKALILNRCEDFENSYNYIESKLSKVSLQSPIRFNLYMIQMMDLIQLGKRKAANKIFNKIKSQKKATLYPYLIRLSNVFYEEYNLRLSVVQSITDSFYESNTAEFCGLHAIYLAYLYALNNEFDLAEASLLSAREFFMDNTIYNHMILHNEALIKFRKNEIDEEIPKLLESARVTAYDEYDKFAINNNLLCYYILINKCSSYNCQLIVMEIEELLRHTHFKRFINKIHYNLYYYHLRMYNTSKSDYYKKKLDDEKISYGDEYACRLMYETSWKIPISIESLYSHK